MQNKIVLVMFTIMIVPLAIFALTGEGTSGSSTMDTVDPDVTVNYPNGGEELYIGDSADITWSATDFGLSANTIKIFYSADNGNNYEVLDSLETNDDIYNWPLPSIICYNNLIKIFAEDNFGNIGSDSSNAAFSITYVPPAPPENVTVDLSNEIDAVISWTEVNTTIFGNPIAVDGYIVLYNETAYEDSLQCYYFLGATNSSTATYTHYRVAEFRDQMFYKVVAYKDYRGNITEILASLNLANGYKPSKWLKDQHNNHQSEGLVRDHSEGKLSWNELQRRFK